MGNVKIDMNSSIGYKDPETQAFKYYGPGKDVEVPESLAAALGIEPKSKDETKLEPSAESSDDREPVDPNAEASEESEAESNDESSDTSDVPEDFPSRELLIENGFDSLAKIREASDEELTSITGIGKAILASIREAQSE